jgi:Spy/CpxP family protein refolding chaperone
MRNRTLTLAMLAAAALLPATLSAQRFGPRADGAPPDPAALVANQVARLTTQLSLTAAQATQATTIFTNAQSAAAPLRTSLNTNHESMRTAVKNNAISTIDQLAATSGLLTGQLEAIQNKANAAFFAILTADQQAKFDLGPGGFGGPGGRGRGGPPPPRAN